MITDSPPRRRRPAALLTALAVAAGAIVLPSGAASAAEGPAPVPEEKRILAGIHTDAVSTFLDDGRLTLGSRADVPEGHGTRFAADDVWFHVGDGLQATLPAGFEFIGPAGSTAWIAPATMQEGELWPGFSTESIARGAIDGDVTDLTLIGVEGRGSLELFDTTGFGSIRRLWSSDDPAHKTFTVGRTHMHANWAFTESGTYKITVEAEVSIGGERQTARATYTFVVGALPAKVQPSVSLTASATDLVLGDSVTLNAAVEPASVSGYIEFRDGETLLGHEPVIDGGASLVVAEVGIGTHAYAASFVPASANVAAAAPSTVVQVVVIEEPDGVEFGIRGLENAFAPGDPISARVVGATLAEGQSYRWIWRPIGGGSGYVYPATSDTEAGRLQVIADMSLHGYEFSVQLRQGRTTVQQSGWFAITVEPDAAAVTASLDQTGKTYLGDPVSVTVGDRQLGVGETYRLVQRWSTSPWEPVSGTTVDGHRISVAPSYAVEGGQWAVQVMREGVAVAQSPEFVVNILNREVMIEGVQGVYREGSTLKATGSLYPEREGLRYTWSFANFAVDPWINTELKTGTGPDALSLEIPATLDLDGGLLYLVAQLDDESGIYVGQASVALNVSSAAPDEQLFFFQGISGHYHQGSDINLQLVADPALADDDTVEWAWRFPGEEEFSPVPDAAGLTHKLVAEQALDDVEARATLVFADGERRDADPIVIQVDDHGAPPRQKVSVTGLQEQYTAGDDITLTAGVSPASVLSRWEWYVQKPGESTPELIAGNHGGELSFGATTEYDGAGVFARLTYPNGDAYVESPPVVLDIVERTEEPVQTTITIAGLAEHYSSGETMTLTASQSPDSGEDRWHWFIKRAGAAQYSVISGQLTSTLVHQVAAEDHGASVIARLYDHDHEVIAESSPVIVAIDDHLGEEPVGAGGKPVEAPQARTGDDIGDVLEGGLELESRTVRQGQIISVGAGAEQAGQWTAAWLFSDPVLLNGDWTQASGAGAITVRIPEDAAIGEHRLAVFAADGSLIGWAAISVTAAGPALTGTLPPTGGAASAWWLAVPLLFVGAGVAAFLFGRRRKSAQD